MQYEFILCTFPWLMLNVALFDGGNNCSTIYEPVWLILSLHWEIWMLKFTIMIVSAFTHVIFAVVCIYNIIISVICIHRNKIAIICIYHIMIAIACVHRTIFCRFIIWRFSITHKPIITCFCTVTRRPIHICTVITMTWWQSTLTTLSVCY